jgi:hypothetical protein
VYSIVGIDVTVDAGWGSIIHRKRPDFLLVRVLGTLRRNVPKQIRALAYEVLCTVPNEPYICPVIHPVEGGLQQLIAGSDCYTFVAVLLPHLKGFVAK